MEEGFGFISGAIGVFVGILVWTFLISKLISLVLGGGVSLVVQKLSIRSGANAGPIGIELVGRREGVVAFFLTLVGLSPTTTLVVDERESVCKTAGLLGVAHQSIPMDRVAKVTSGSNVAFEYIVSASITGLVGLLITLMSLMNFALLSIIGVPIMTAVFIGIAMFLYSLNKRFYVGVYSQGAGPILLAFKPNVLEGVELNLDRALEIAAIIRKLTADSRHSRVGTIPATAARPKANVTVAVEPIERNHAERGVANPVDRSGYREDLEPMSASVYAGLPDAGQGYFKDGEPITASGLLRDAQNQIRTGKRDDAIVTLRQLIQHFPVTQEADQAVRALARAKVSK